MGRKKAGRKRSPVLKKDSRWGFRGMTVRDWVDLLIVPLTLTVAGFLFTLQQDARQQEIDDQRSQDAALQAYLASMSDLLIHEQDTQLVKLDPDIEVQRLIQARTETVFETLDPSREVRIVLFLAQADLIPKRDPLVSFAGIDLSSIDLRGIDLSNTSLTAANLTEAILTNVNLSGSDLQDANLRYANILAADLSDANLVGTVLTNANLEGANVTDEQLDTARSLEGAIMPDGSIHP